MNLAILLAMFIAYHPALHKKKMEAIGLFTYIWCSGDQLFLRMKLFFYPKLSILICVELHFFADFKYFFLLLEE